MKLRLRAHAKVNLALRVGARRADGYHAVVTVLQTIDLADRVTVARRERGGATAVPPVHLSMSWEALPGRRVEVATRDNTVWRALVALHRTLRALGGDEELPRLSVRVDKRIPPGAGLGGGSSDAAAAVVGAWKLWGGDGLEDLLELGGARIVGAAGTDAPFFLLGGTALGSGRGDELRVLESVDPAWMVVAAPDVAVSTAAAYAALDGERQQDADVPLPGVPDYRPDLDPAWMTNDLEGPVVAAHPEIGEVRARLERAGATVARMTGSGSACLGVFRDRGAAEVAAAGLRAEGLWARACRTLSRDEHLEGLLGAGNPGERRGAG